MINKLSTVQILLITLVSFIAFRGLTLELFDFSEPTETRYAVIASDMIHLDNWVTPQFPRGMGHEPYLGKPPLYFWLVAFSQSIFGFDEWTARLPSFLTTIASGVVIFLVGSIISREIAFTALLMWLSTVFTYFFSGAVMLDPVLSTFITISLACYYALYKKIDLFKCSSFALQLIFWTSLSAGFLTKGPISAIFIALPILSLSIISKSIEPIKVLNLWLGTIISLILVVPWFYLAELETPGFIRYFFINENFLRFFVKDYGDKYGTGHRYPYGSVWWMLIAGMLPWSFFLLRLISERKYLLREIKRNKDLQFFLCWGLSIPIFLTFMKQLHPGYILPAFPGLCLALACFRTSGLNKITLAWDIYLRKIINALFSILFIVICVYSYLKPFDWGRMSLVAIFIASLFTIFLNFREKQWATYSPLKRLTDLSFALFTIFFACSIFLSREISEKTSPTSILRCLARSTPFEEKPNISFIGNRSYTAHYFNESSQTELNKGLKINLVEEPIKEDSSLFENIVVKKKYAKSIPPEYKVVHQIKDYIWYSSNTEQIRLDKTCATDLY